MSLRVLVLNVSVVDLTVHLAKATSYAEICKAMKIASEGELKGLLQYTNDEVVSSDFIGNPHSAIFDKKAGIQLSPTFRKVVAWYNNEWEFSNKLVDFIAHIAKVNA